MVKKTKEPIKKQNTEAGYAAKIIVVLLCLIAIYFISSSYFQNMNKINYKGLIFIKNQTAGVTFYEHYYYLEKGGKIYPSILYIRINPKENKVPISGNIEFPMGKFVYITTNLSSIDRCEDNFVATTAFRLFLAYNGLTVRESSPDKEEALAFNLSYTDCDNRPGNPIIWIAGSDKTSINKTGANCYRINVKGCDLTAALEKFEVQTLIDSHINKTNSI